MIGMTPLQLPSDAVYFLLTMRVHLAYGAGARWSNGTSVHEVQADANLLSAFALMIGGALGVAFPMTVVIILDLFLTALLDAPNGSWSASSPR